MRLKKGTYYINTIDNPANNPLELTLIGKPVEGYGHKDIGLFIHGKGSSWTITHVKSGRSLTMESSRKRARKLVIDISEVYGFNQTEKELLNHKREIVNSLNKWREENAKIN